MQFTGDHAKTRVRNGKVMTRTFTERENHLWHIEYQRRLRDKRVAITESLAWDLDRRVSMELLTSERKYNEGKGRGSIPSGFNTENLLVALDVETLAEAVQAVIGLNSPYLKATVANKDWYGTVSGAMADLEAQLVEEGIDGIAISRRTVDKAERKNVIKFTFRVDADSTQDHSEEE